MLQTIRHFLSLIRFSHTLFALPFALLAALMAWRMQAIDYPAPEIDPYDPTTYSIGAGGTQVFIHDPYLNILGFQVIPFDWARAAKFQIRWQELVGILLCMVFARSAAMAFNRLVDRNLDALNPRTAGRHIPAGLLSAGQVTFFAIACSAGFVASTLLFLPNWLPLYLAVPVLAFLCGYSYAKRFTSLAHFWLGVALAMSPIAAWIAIRGETVALHPADLLPAIVLGAAVAAWVAGFDVIYACQDFAYDREAKLHSIPVRLGVAGALRLAAACHFVTIVLLALLPLIYPPFGGVWWAGVAAVAALLVYEHALVRPDDLARVNTAFFNVNAIISLGLLVVGTVDLLL
ncbi:UbiA-like polyprenyltransferase [Lacipirellula limnantheis]|uniref:4-hydroxybenzoate polyprenyltransferase n=1 Tax=Lacipirellula limnantheis TaxID=2528024 RepID=A0A517U2W7_9BACT|nr:UbiA-like polyprenyltransferase [Lacipirellula limnantheis]QDT74967.1 prenyltransferase [Lacipirellula limnantheis]